MDISLFWREAGGTTCFFTSLLRSSRTSSILPAIALTVHRLSGMAIVGFLSSPLMVDPIHTLFAFVDCSHDPRHVCIFEK